MSHYKVLGNNQCYSIYEDIIPVMYLEGVSRDASKVAIRAAYLQKAKRYHPDVNQSPQAEKLFKAIQEAYQILNDEAKKREFDAVQGSHSSVDSDSVVGSPRFKGRIYDPEKERQDFSREFYEQAEALRREMEVRSTALSDGNKKCSETSVLKKLNDRPQGDFREHLRRLSVHLFWKSIPYIVVPSMALLAYSKYRSTSAAWREQSPVLHDMYGRAYITDRFGRRARAPRYDDKKRLDQWEAMKQTDKTLSLTNPYEDKDDTDDSELNNISTIKSNQDSYPPRTRITFAGLDRIAASKQTTSVDDGTAYSPSSMRPVVNSVRAAEVAATRHPKNLPINNQSNSSDMITSLNVCPTE